MESSKDSTCKKVGYLNFNKLISFFINIRKIFILYSSNFRSASLDVEPLYTFRSHTGPVLCLAMCSTGNQCYSGGTDGMIDCWTLPSANIDPYDTYEPSVLSQTLKGHTNAVWGLSMYQPRSQLLSISADGTVKLWSPQSKSPLLHTYISKQGVIFLSL